MEPSVAIQGARQNYKMWYERNKIHKTKCKILDTRCMMQNLIYKIQDARCKIQDTIYKMQDTKCKMTDTRPNMQVAGNKMQDARQKDVYPSCKI